MELTRIEENIAEYLENHHKIDNPISMKDLSNLFGLRERETRDVIEKIILTERLVIGNTNGYWVAATAEEKDLANKLNRSRIKTSLKRLAANNGSLTWIYNYLNELQKQYPNVPEEQVSLYENE